ncbi:MAG: sensor histidine kinase [Actinomycetota bacterium]
MSTDRASTRAATADGARALGRGARVSLLILVGAVAVFESVWLLTGASTDPFVSAVAQLALTLSFGVFAWRPAAAAMLLVACGSISLLLDVGLVAVLVLAVAVGLVVATCAKGVVAGYAVALVVLALLAPTRVEGGSVEDTATLLIVAALSSAVGLSLRLLRGRERSLTLALVEQDAARDAATQIERDRIADELHDLIAHELTVIAMHAQVLQRTDDAGPREIAQRAISDAARKALADIRRVLHVAQVSRDEPYFDVDSVRNQLVVSLTDVKAQIESTGGAVALPDDVAAIAAALPPSLDTTLGRIAREAATNVLKHAGSGARVTIRLRRVHDEVRMSVHDRAGAQPRQLDIPSGGYGLARMRARAEVLGGSFHAGPFNGGWLVEVRLPLA